jgi:gluconolactonase
VGVREIARGLRFPEGPVALPDGSVLVVEIAAGRLSRVLPDGRIRTVAELGGGPNGAALGPDGRCYVCNNGGFAWAERDGLLSPRGTAPDYAGGRIEVVDLATGAARVLYGPDGPKGRLNGPNDLVFDAAGGFWFTDHGHTHRDSRDRGAVYYARADGSRLERVVFPLEMPNGIALSPDGTELYVAETVTARLWAFRVTAPGRIDPSTRNLLGNPGRLVHGRGGFHLFDSIKVGADGLIHVATIPGEITVIAPDGTLVRTIAIPGETLVTNLCFDPADPRVAYVTLSSSGRLVAVDLPGPADAPPHGPT